MRRARRTSVLSLLGVAGAAAVGLPLAATVSGAPPKLPDLVSTPVQGIGTQIYRDGRLLIRFDGYVTNSASASAPLEIQASGANSAEVMTKVQQFVNGSPVQPGPGGPPVVRFEAADGHNHWHLKNAAEYSLWNAGATAQLAIAQKTQAGFCLEDSENAGGGAKVYSAGSNSFCGQGQTFAKGNAPNPLIMGISPGWKDKYNSGLSFQWVDVSNVTPGQYKLASRVNPDRTINESEYGNDGYVFVDTTVPGYAPHGIDAGRVDPGQSLPITLAADKFTGQPFPSKDNSPQNGDTSYGGVAADCAAFPTSQVPKCSPVGPVAFVITSLPSLGTLSQNGSPLSVGAIVSEDAPSSNSATITYTPASGQRGADSFGYQAYDSTEPQFPTSKPTAAVAIQVGAPVTSVAISGAPASMLAGTAVQLSAMVTNGPAGATWSASAGSITPTGLFTAPHAPGVVTVRATSRDDPSVSAAVTIQVVPVGKQAAAPLTASTKMIAGFRVGRIGPRLLLTRVVTGPRGGKLTVTATFRRRVLARCTKRIGAQKAFTCRIRLKHRYDLRRVRITAKLTVPGGTSAVRRAFAVR